jgi:MFS transporter, YNFM family, putative membrane transport protein
VRKPPTLPVVLAGASAFLNLYATQPLLPLFARIFHATPFQVGLTITAPTVAVAIFAPMVGRLADTIGLRRVIVGSAFLLAVASALAATAATLTQLIIWRFVQGVVTPGVFASTVAYIHEMWPAERTGRATAGYMSGTIVGGFFGRASSGLIASAFDWHVAFAFLALCAFAIAIVLWRRLPDERARDSTGSLRPVHGPAVSALFRNRRLVATWAIGFCVLFTNVAMFTYVTFHLAAPPYNLSSAALGWLFLVYLVGAVVTPVSGRWIDKYGHRLGLTIAMAVGATGALLTLVPALWAIVAGLALSSTGVFIAQTSTSSYIGAVTATDRGLAVGLYSTFYYAGGSAGGAAPAVVWNAAGWAGCVALVVAIQIAGALIALLAWRGRRVRLKADTT